MKILFLIIWILCLSLSVGILYVNRDTDLPIGVTWAACVVFAVSLAAIEVFGTW